MHTITFYAYKGGTGRTLALVKAAQFLAEEGKTVFVLDLDLEAPGLHFKLLDDKQRESLCPGFVELARAYVVDADFLDVQDHHVVIERPGAKGQIHLMPAGRSLGGDYWKTLSSELNWQKLFEGDLPEAPAFFLWLKEQVEEKIKPDYFLIDARTGVTEVGGAALTLLPDDIVLLFANNPESVWGTREAIRAIRRVSRPASLGPVRIVPVLARFPHDREAEQKIAIVNALEVINRSPRDETSAPYEPKDVHVLHSYRMVEVEELTELKSDPEGQVLYRDYLRLFQDGLELRDLEELELRAVLQEAEQADVSETSKGKWTDALGRLRRRNRTSAEELTYVLLRLARLLGSLKEFDRAIEYLEEIVSTPNVSAARRGEALQYLAVCAAKSKQLDAAQRKDQALTHYDQQGDARTAIRFLKLLAAELTENHEFYRTLVMDRARRTRAAIESSSADALGLELQELEAALERLAGKLSEDRLSQIEVRLELVALRRLGGESMTTFKDLARIEQELVVLAPEDQRLVDVRRELSAAALATTRSLKESKRSHTRLSSSTAITLPAKTSRSTRRGAETTLFEIPLLLVTPLLGGATWTREIDEIDVVRVASIRGHLRFWWRALHAGRVPAEELYKRERGVWGGAADDDGGRSAVELALTVESAADIDASDVMPYGKFETPGAYALWPARATRGRDPQPVARRRSPGTRFRLRITCELGSQDEVRAALRAWILFGGYGGRTRRGAGSLTVDGSDRRAWLLRDETHASVVELFQRDILEPLPSAERDDLVLLAGAGLRVGRPTPNAIHAWTTALHWLRDFRQAQPSSGTMGFHDPGYARDRGDNQRPGRSNWPEADKVRQLSGSQITWAHPPRHNASPVWPRAGFGLPIVAQFQRASRTRSPYAPAGEPREFELRWRDHRGKEHDRVGSPLIVKALPLANGEFVPCALWLFRGYPKDGNVALESKDSRSLGSEAAFDELVAPGDKAMFDPLARAMSAPEGARLRTAFFDWLAKKSVKVVAP